MKMMFRNLTEQFLSNVSRLPFEVGKQKSRPNVKKSPPPPPGNKFFSWHKARPRLLDIVAIDQDHVTINLSLLEKLVSSAHPQEISYQSLIASYLQHQSVGTPSAIAIKNALAVRKMVALVSTTVQEMRMIELLYSSRQKG